MDAFAAALDRVDVLVNNAGGAFDAKPVAEADLDSWARTYDVNVLGTVRLTKALLPALRASGAGDVLFVSSTAGLISYEGGASYTAAKHGVHTLVETLRLELCGEPVRVIEIAPGMVRTEEFSLNRLGSADAADSVYRGVREPLVAEDVADCIGWAVTRPAPREHRPDGDPPARPGRPAQGPPRELGPDRRGLRDERDAELLLHGADHPVGELQQLGRGRAGFRRQGEAVAGRRPDVALRACRGRSRRTGPARRR